MSILFQNLPRLVTFSLQPNVPFTLAVSRKNLTKSTYIFPYRSRLLGLFLLPLLVQVGTNYLVLYSYIVMSNTLSFRGLLGYIRFYQQLFFMYFLFPFYTEFFPFLYYFLLVFLVLYIVDPLIYPSFLSSYIYLTYYILDLLSIYNYLTQYFLQQENSTTFIS